MLTTESQLEPPFHWYVLIVKRNYEKRVSQHLERLGIEVFCPLIKKSRQWSDRTKVLEVPIFNSYVFVKLPEKDRNRVFDVVGILKYLFWLGKPAIARDAEIQTIRTWLMDKRIHKLSFTALTPGKVVKIERGLLKDQNATIQQVRKNELRLVLNELGIVVIAQIADVA